MNPSQDMKHIYFHCCLYMMTCFLLISLNYLCAYLNVVRAVNTTSIIESLLIFTPFGSINIILIYITSLQLLINSLHRVLISELFSGLY